MWRAVYAPGDGQTSPAYSSQSVQRLYINHLMSVNKLVLSYLLLRLLLQWLPRSGCTLCIVHCTIVHSPSHSHIGSISASRSLFRTSKWFCFEDFCSVHSICYNFDSTFLLGISYRNQQFLFIFIFLLEVSREQPQRSTLNTLLVAHNCRYSLAQFLTLLLWYFVCHIPACNWFFC